MQVVAAYLIDKSMTHALTFGVEAVSLGSGRGVVWGDFRRTSCHLLASNCLLCGSTWKIAPYRWKRPGMQGDSASLRVSSQNHPRNFQAALFYLAVLGLSACGEMIESHTAQPTIRRSNRRQGLPPESTSPPSEADLYSGYCADFLSADVSAAAVMVHGGTQKCG
jgi:hypothetical protein